MQLKYSVLQYLDCPYALLDFFYVPDSASLLFAVFLIQGGPKISLIRC